MKYKDLIGTLTAYQTPSIRAIAFPKSCAPDRLPDAFLSLLAGVVKILDAHRDQLCDTAKEVVVLFSLQHLSLNLTSDAPNLLHRKIDINRPTEHFCCSLEYLVLPKHQLNHVSSWQGAKSVVIDFTTGMVMDNDYYCCKLFNTKPTGQVYGKLNYQTLRQAWRAISLPKKSIDKPRRNIKDFFFPTPIGALL